MKFYHYFKTNKNEIYKCESILKFANWAEKNNIEDWIVIQRICKQAIEVA
jgi:hypothetical protein